MAEHGTGSSFWGRLTHSRVLSVLKNPCYAGMYVFGRYQYRKQITAAGEIRKRVQVVARPDWRVSLKEHHQGYISCEEFEKNAERLEKNRTNGEETVLSGPAREGLALLQGMLLCGSCGRALTVRYLGNGGMYPTYLCNRLLREGLASSYCMSFRCDLLDAAISEEVLKALQPAELNWPWLRCTSWKSAIRLYSTNGRCGWNAPNMKPRSPSELSGSRSFPAAGRRYSGAPLERSAASA